MIGAANKPKFDWRTIINQFVSEIVAKDYSFERADNRFLHNGIIIPDLYSKAVANIVIAIDRINDSFRLVYTNLRRWS